MSVMTTEQRLALGLLATDARIALTGGSCALCPNGIVRGDRVATLPGGHAAHLGCIGRTALAPRRHGVPAIR